jgi:tetratricopeptide (TPR) repeat protein
VDLGDRLLAQDKPAEALGVWQQELAKRPNDTRLLISIATAQARLRHLDDAEATLRRAIAIEPQSPRVRQNLALVYLKQKDLDKALAAFQNVLDIEATYPRTCYFMGLIHEMRGDEATAEKCYVREVNNGACVEAWDRLRRLTEKKRALGIVPHGPDKQHVILFSVVLLGVAAAAYGLRAYLDRGGPPARGEQDR